MSSQPKPSQPEPSQPESKGSHAGGSENKGFENNWAYLRTELKWLEQVLMRAVTRHRQTQKAVERYANSPADRVTSHWWQGLIAFDRSVGHDSYHKPPAKPGPKQTYSQQLERRLQVSADRGTVLGLPTVCDRLQLTAFEKALVLTALAPEVNRRYTQLYQYLQSEDTIDFPTVDLVLRLFCRNDAEWRSARARLTSPSPLIQADLLHLNTEALNRSLLSQPLKLAAPLVNYLLADQPDLQALEQMLASPGPLETTDQSPDITQIRHPIPLSSTSHIHQQPSTVSWTDLILPQTVLNALKSYTPGTVALLTGDRGNGKTLSANVLASAYQAPLTWIDLALVPPAHYSQLWADLQTLAPAVLLIKSAQCACGRLAQSDPGILSPAPLRQWIDHRRHHPGITLFSTPWIQAIRPSWQQEFDSVLQLPRPSKTSRLRLWKRALKGQALSDSINLEHLANRLKLNGGEIKEVVHSAKFQAEATGTMIQSEHIQFALNQRGIRFNFKRH